MAAYISGIRTADRSINVKIWEASVDPKKGILDVKVSSNADPSIENLHISYVIWRANFGFDVKVFQNGDNFKADYELFGVNRFKRSQENTEILALVSDRMDCVGGGCQNPCTTSPDCKKKGGILVDDICYLCGDNEKFWDNQCIPNCVENE